MYVPNVEWALEIGAVSPKAKKPGLSKHAIIEAVSKALQNITHICRHDLVQFHPKYDPLKLLRRPGKPNILRLRFHVDRPALRTKLERLDPKFKWLRPQNDYAK